MLSKVELPKITDSEENKSIFIIFQVAEIAASKGGKNIFVLMEVFLVSANQNDPALKGGKHNRPSARNVGEQNLYEWIMIVNNKPLY